MGAAPRIGVSRCLLGDAVRYDGGHKRDLFLGSAFGPHVEWVPVCPEVETGMGVPREPVRLVSHDGTSDLRLLGVSSSTDWTAAIRAWSYQAVQALGEGGVSGYILKEGSPSCGTSGVPVHGGAVSGERSRIVRRGEGLFAAALRSALPDLPVEDERRLRDSALRDNFIERVFAYRRMRALFGGRWTRGSVGRFHALHRVQLLAHSRSPDAALGALVAQVARVRRAEFASRYQTGFMARLSRRATPSRHAAAMRYLLAHLRGRVDRMVLDEIKALVADYRWGAVPFTVPTKLLRHHLRTCGMALLGEQTYLDPDPLEVSLRNHV